MSGRSSEEVKAKAYMWEAYKSLGQEPPTVRHCVAVGLRQ
jgi:hypothetical protein